MTSSSDDDSELLVLRRGLGNHDFLFLIGLCVGFSVPTRLDGAFLLNLINFRSILLVLCDSLGAGVWNWLVCSIFYH